LKSAPNGTSARSPLRGHQNRVFNVNPMLRYFPTPKPCNARQWRMQFKRTLIARRRIGQRQPNRCARVANSALDRQRG